MGLGSTEKEISLPFRWDSSSRDTVPEANINESEVAMDGVPTQRTLVFQIIKQNAGQSRKDPGAGDTLLMAATQAWEGGTFMLWAV